MTLNATLFPVSPSPRSRRPLPAFGGIRMREVRSTVIPPPPDRIGDASTGHAMTDASTAAHAIREFYNLADDPQENMIAVYLNSRGEAIASERVYRGTVNSANVSCRDIARGCLAYNAPLVLIAHNHPSGNPSPSGEDHVFTGKLKQALALLDIGIFDHLIIAARRHYSLREMGHL